MQNRDVHDSASLEVVARYRSVKCDCNRAQMSHPEKWDICFLAADFFNMGNLSAIKKAGVLGEGNVETLIRKTIARFLFAICIGI